jgi:hypothetical protein
MLYSMHNLVLVSVGLEAYLFRPGGRRGLIPTKTPACFVQLFGRFILSSRISSYVFVTDWTLRAFLPYLLLSVRSLSIVSLRLITCSHLLWISCVVCCASGLSPLEMRLSHLSFQIKYADSDTRIL